jgi:hypothetical protein
MPRELPGGTRHFAGREAVLAAVGGLLDHETGVDAPPTVVISAIGGTAGMGKTGLRCGGSTRWRTGSPTRSCT